MASISKAVMWLKQGKKVRMSTWDYEHILYIYAKIPKGFLKKDNIYYDPDSNKNGIVNNLYDDKGEPVYFIGMTELISKDWEIFEEQINVVINKNKDTSGKVIGPDNGKRINIKQIGIINGVKDYQSFCPFCNVECRGYVPKILYSTMLGHIDDRHRRQKRNDIEFYSPFLNKLQEKKNE